MMDADISAADMAAFRREQKAKGIMETIVAFSHAAMEITAGAATAILASVTPYLPAKALFVTAALVVAAQGLQRMRRAYAPHGINRRLNKMFKNSSAVPS